MSKGSPLAKLARQSRCTYFLDFETPAGKDGFYATISLMSFIPMLIRAYGKPLAKLQELISPQKIYKQIDSPIEPLLKKDTWVVLYGKWGLPVAIDIEEKITSAALKNIQRSDYKNFFHGRNLWLKSRKDAGVVALITPDEKEVAGESLSIFLNILPYCSLLQVKTEQLAV